MTGSSSFSNELLLRPIVDRSSNASAALKNLRAAATPQEAPIAPSTEQQRLATALRNIEERFLSVIEVVSEAMVLVDVAGQIVLANSQTEVLFGYSRDELVGEPIELLLPERFRERHVALRNQFFAEPYLLTLSDSPNLLARRKDGSECPIEISLRPMPTDIMMLFVATIRDITKRRNLEEQLRQSQMLAAVGRLAGGVAHDFNNLLTIINSYSELLLDDTSDDDPRRPLILEIKSAGDRAAGLTHQLSASTPKQVLEPSPPPAN